jgi:multicomponent K+:H+ antiporter subunit D
VIAGLPPLSGFLAKFAMLAVLLDPRALDATSAAADIPATHWLFVALLVLAGVTAIVAMSRTGARLFWSPQGRAALHLRAIECLPIAAFLVLFAALTVRAGPILDYTRAAAAGVIDPTRYVEAVLAAAPVSSPGARAPGPGVPR